MPLETIGSIAVAGSSGASARSARTVTTSNTSDAAANGTFAASSARGGDTGNSVIELPSPAPNVAAYLSPFIRLDLRTRLAIVEFRDSHTGEVKRQYPSPRVVREYEQNLPEESELRTTRHQDGADAHTGEPPKAGGTRIFNFGSGKSDGDSNQSSAVPTVPAATVPAAPVAAPAVTRAAIAAFNTASSNASNAVDATGGRQVAVA